MASQLGNELCGIKHCWGIYEHNSIVNDVGDWRADWTIIAKMLIDSDIIVCFK